MPALHSCFRGVLYTNLFMKPRRHTAVEAISRRGSLCAFDRSSVIMTLFHAAARAARHPSWLSRSGGGGFPGFWAIPCGFDERRGRIRLTLAHHWAFTVLSTHFHYDSIALPP